MNLSEIVVAAIESGETSFDIPLPTAEGYKLRDLRLACAERGRGVQFRFEKPTSDTDQMGLRVLLLPEPTPPVVALAMLVRDDVAGLERAILSAISQVDEIVIVVDGRSDDATKAVADAYSDTMEVFTADDIELSEDDWNRDRIHFANARNFGRRLVRSEWSLVVDADEVFIYPDEFNLSKALLKFPKTIGAVHLAMGTSAFSQKDAQRLARTSFRFFSAMHNQLPIEGDVVDSPQGVSILHDVSLRPELEQKRRVAQREAGIDELAKEGRKGNISALFHVAKHYLGHHNIEQGVKLTEYFRLRTAIHGQYSAERTWLALSCAAIYHEFGRLAEAEVWGIRALLDGPGVEALGILGDIAEEMGDINRARKWYEMACAIEGEAEKFSIEGEANRRFTRRDSLRITLMRGQQDSALMKTG